MHAPPQADLHLLQLGLHALANRLPKHHEPSLLCLPADVREAEEVEGLGLTQTSNCWYYDQWGNRLDAEGSATAYSSTAGGASPCSGQPVVQYNTNNQMTGSGAPNYDQAGDATSDAKGRQYLYDAEGRICAVKGAAVDGISAMVGYVYDADGNRVAKGPITSWSCDPTTNGFESSAYETDYVLNQSGQTVTETTKSDTGVMQWNFTNVYANGVLFATYDAQGLHFLLNDWLGTRRASTDYEGVLESLCASLPYGDQLQCTNSPQSPNEQHFTGKQHDQETGNDYFGARYYAENDARFMSPDWSAKVEPVPYAKLGDPQSLNLYGYMLDRPLDGVDQNGHQCAACKKFMRAVHNIVELKITGGAGYALQGGIGGLKLNIREGAWTSATFHPFSSQHTTLKGFQGTKIAASLFTVKGQFNNPAPGTPINESRPGAKIGISRGKATVSLSNTGKISLVSLGADVGAVGGSFSLNLNVPNLETAGKTFFPAMMEGGVDLINGVFNNPGPHPQPPSWKLFPLGEARQYRQ